MAIRRIYRTYTLAVPATAQLIDLRKALLAVPSQVKAGDTMRIMTSGTSRIWVKFGDSSVVATVGTTGTTVDDIIPMSSDQIEDIDSNDYTHMSVIGESTGTTIFITFCDLDRY